MTEPALDKDAAFLKAIELAPRYEQLSHLARAVNEALDLTWTESAWRGYFVRNPEWKERILKLLGTTKRQQSPIVRILGNVRGVVFSDIHAPFHDKRAIALAAQVAKWWKPTVAIFNGDDLDCYRLSRFSQNPDRTERLQDEIDLWHIEVAAPLLAALPPAPKTTAEGGQRIKVISQIDDGTCRRFKTRGNHEQRLEEVLWTNPGLFGLRSLDLAVLMELDRLNIEYAPLKVLFGTTLEVSHGTRVRPHAGYTARAESEKRRFGISTITGHVHRAGSYTTRTVSGNVRAQEAPCLCQLEPEYVDDPDWVDWTQGVTLFEIRDGKLRIDAVEFYPDYTCMVGGKYFSL